MKHIRAVFMILFMLVVIIVAVQNYEAMSTAVKFRVDFLFFQHETAEMSLYLIVVISFLVGVIFSALYGITERFRQKREIKRLEREAREKDKELNSLRNLPVTADDVNNGESSVSP
ncbi:MAG: LapA family protein [Deltaproteobacteria bacterium]|nr:LapA family protein [Deltaproteobacteria bacterium]MBW1925024.1 LapA family protein [Deltaproteobacteria bacterium]MBW1950169.1 LapA family protein [Deltaproteobacteria bacterium]MBW2007985.1 LapA family protein [Deltaproteobacteria bacterium]MBW2101849.1 LapA family protein [Deltaproteobacteria bacterium]